MKDIIAAQHIQRRVKPSLLSNTQTYRGITDNSIVADQHLPKRKKKSLLEVIRAKKAAGTFGKDCPGFLKKQEVSRGSASRSGASKIRVTRASEKKQPREKNLRRTFQFSGVLQRTEHWLTQNPKKLVLGFFVCFSVLAFVLFGNYIPDPEPPEDRVIREQYLPPELSEGGDDIPLDLTEVFAWQNYTVRPGDVVETIAKRYRLSMDAVIASNNLRNVRRLQAGQAIRIPNMDGIPYTVKNGDSYSKIAAAFEVPLEALLDANDIQNDEISAGTVLFIPGARMDRTALREALGELFVWPISGRRTSAFGWRNDPLNGIRSFHAAMDISAPIGTAVRASTDGRVSSVGYSRTYGNFIVIKHSREYESMYAHLNRIFVKNGTSVDQGTIIAQSGNTGRSTGPHLHFAVYKNGRAINPLEVLNN